MTVVVDLVAVLFIAALYWLAARNYRDGDVYFAAFDASMASVLLIRTALNERV